MNNTDKTKIKSFIARLYKPIAAELSNIASTEECQQAAAEITFVAPTNNQS